MSSELAAWLRRQREDRGWTRTELARQLIRAARARSDTSLPGTDNISHNIYRWERGAVTPAERYKLLYCSAFGISFSQFGPDADGRCRRAWSTLARRSPPPPPTVRRLPRKGVRPRSGERC